MCLVFKSPLFKARRLKTYSEILGFFVFGEFVEPAIENVIRTERVKNQRCFGMLGPTSLI